MSFIQPKKIALTGLAKSGKSTVAEYLKKVGYTELSFANPIKEIVKSLFGIADKYLYDAEYKNDVIPEVGVSARSLLQNIGTELFRVELNKLLPDLKIKNIWIHKLGLQLKELRNKSGSDPSGSDPSVKDASEPLVVVSDVRFDDEYQFLKDNGFTVIKINRPSLNVSGSRNLYNHVSESGCKYDIEIQNDSSLEELYKKIDNIVYTI
jgi:hypothetical protein